MAGTSNFNHSSVAKIGLSLVSPYFQWEGELDGWQMMPIDDTGTDLWTVAGAWQGMAGGGGAVSAGVFDLPIEG